MLRLLLAWLIILNCFENLQAQDSVYVSLMPKMKTFHKDTTCSSFKSSNARYVKIDIESAKTTYKRKPCCLCAHDFWRCTIDNPSTGTAWIPPGSVGDAQGAMGLAAFTITVAAVIVSNDVYFYPYYSFETKGKTMSAGYDLKAEDGNGICFGLRRNFKHRTLEYGFSYLNYTGRITDPSGYTYFNYYGRTGLHLTLLQHFLYHDVPPWLQLYAGPSVNYVYKGGFGGAAGASLLLGPQWKFDARYELTTRTNQLQFGLIYTYQKKFRWNKKK